MNKFVAVNQHNDHTSVCLSIEEGEIMAIGEKMEAINEEAYMNGYNWEAFLNKYLAIYHEELLNGLEADSEAGAYVALYQNADSEKASKLAKVINELINNTTKIYSFLQENGEEIEWD